eukprot:TRINITY_DN72197_c0_g1_i1.p1 TRINITY_DN72197_c0_g1~~TRINITY_DN72197_c0_g1_i1.p1  ORF type:complete len:260 (+),score=63.69 TRINITY_DN72197_c0_g1_i1:165-944(+)
MQPQEQVLDELAREEEMLRKALAAQGMLSDRVASLREELQEATGSLSSSLEVDAALASGEEGTSKLGEGSTEAEAMEVEQLESELVRFHRAQSREVQHHHDEVEELREELLEVEVRMRGELSTLRRELAQVTVDREVLEAREEGVRNSWTVLMQRVRDEEIRLDEAEAATLLELEEERQVVFNIDLASEQLHSLGLGGPVAESAAGMTPVSPCASEPSSRHVSVFARGSLFDDLRTNATADNVSTDGSVRGALALNVED